MAGGHQGEENLLIVQDEGSGCWVESQANCYSLLQTHPSLPPSLRESNSRICRWFNPFLFWMSIFIIILGLDSRLGGILTFCLSGHFSLGLRRHSSVRSVHLSFLRKMVLPNLRVQSLELDCLGLDPGSYLLWLWTSYLTSLCLIFSCAKWEQL